MSNCKTYSIYFGSDEKIWIYIKDGKTLTKSFKGLRLDPSS